MKRQAKSSGKAHCSATVLRRLQAAYRTLDRTLARQPWLVLGTVNVVAPKSPGGNVTYTWTRKVQAKTVTVALSQKQAMAFRQAIAENRRVEKALARLHEVSQTALLMEVAGVKTAHRCGRKAGSRNVPKGS